MEQRIQLGLIRECKSPFDARVALTPTQCAYITKNYPVDITIEPSPVRCFLQAEYEKAGISFSNDLQHCQLLLGIKEVPIDQLIENKTYFFFSHTIKGQPHNRKLLQSILSKQIQLVDYEVLTNDSGARLIAFGHFAGMVGAHNGLWTYGKRTGLFKLPRMRDLNLYAEAKSIYPHLEWPDIKIVLTGTGRVGNGAETTLLDMGIHQVSADEFLGKNFTGAVFTQLSAKEYTRHKKGKHWDRSHFVNHPEEYESSFDPFRKTAHIFINAILFHPGAPPFFTSEALCQEDTKIEVIADVTCDIAPNSSIPVTLHATTIDDPIFNINPCTMEIQTPFHKNGIDVMAIDNLPSELPRDASHFFGEQFIRYILPEILSGTRSTIIERATITRGGKLTPRYAYLQDYIEGREIKMPI